MYFLIKDKLHISLEGMQYVLLSNKWVIEVLESTDEMCQLTFDNGDTFIAVENLADNDMREDAWLQKHFSKQVLFARCLRQFYNQCPEFREQADEFLEEIM